MEVNVKRSKMSKTDVAIEKANYILERMSSVSKTVLINAISTDFLNHKRICRYCGVLTPISKNKTDHRYDCPVYDATALNEMGVEITNFILMLESTRKKNGSKK